MGLGNPGEKYKNNRHNVGFLTIDMLCRALGVIQKANCELKTKNKSKFGAEISICGSDFEKIFLIKPYTFMNQSGQPLKTILRYYQQLRDNQIRKKEYKNLYVIHDDLDIKLGDYKIVFAKGPKVHHGLASIEENLATKKFWRVRIGVDNRNAYKRISGEKYVLQDFLEDEKKIINEVFNKVTQKLIEILLFCQRVPHTSVGGKDVTKLKLRHKKTF